jgi:hypothetical protein
MVRARNIYAGNDINRVFRVVYYYGIFVLHFLPLKCAPAKKKKKQQQISPALCNCHSRFYWNIYERLTNSRSEN